MPVMLRQKGKARKIVWNILGVPANIASKESSARKRIDKYLIASETTRSRY